MADHTTKEAPALQLDRAQFDAAWEAVFEIEGLLALLGDVLDKAVDENDETHRLQLARQGRGLLRRSDDLRAVLMNTLTQEESLEAQENAVHGIRKAQQMRSARHG